MYGNDACISVWSNHRYRLPLGGIAVNSSTHTSHGKRHKDTMISKPPHHRATRAPSAAFPEVSSLAVKDLVKIFKLLSDETRLRVLLYLGRPEELHVRALCERLGQNQPVVSHHLSLLRMAGFVESRRDGKRNYYRILPDRFQQLLDVMFAKVPKRERRIRFENYVLSYAPDRDEA